MGQFERFEYKYLTTKAQAEKFKQSIMPHIFTDTHSNADGSYDISSLYFDNERFELYYHTKNRIPFRQKLRLRVYGNAEQTSRSFFEVKNKLNGKTYKNRISLPLSEAVALYKCASSGAACEQFKKYAPTSSDTLALDEVTRVIRRYSLKPAAVISYNREAYFCPELPSLRITFDSRLRVRGTDLILTHGSYGTPVMTDDEVVIEVKCDQNITVWLSQSLGLYRMMNHSYSKYCSLDISDKKIAERELSIHMS